MVYQNSPLFLLALQLAQMPSLFRSLLDLPQFLHMPYLGAGLKMPGWLAQLGHRLLLFRYCKAPQCSHLPYTHITSSRENCKEQKV